MGELRYLFGGHTAEQPAVPDSAVERLHDFYDAGNTWAVHELPALEARYQAGQFYPLDDCQAGLSELAGLIDGRPAGPVNMVSWDRYMRALHCLRFRAGYDAAPDVEPIEFLYEIHDALERSANGRHVVPHPSVLRRQLNSELDATLAEAFIAMRSHMCVWAAEGPARLPEHVLGVARQEIEQAKRSKLAADLGAVAAVLNAEISW